MLTNATATFRRVTTEYDDDSGRRTEGEAEVVAQDEPVLYSPQRFAKRVYHGNSLAEHVKTLPKISIPNPTLDLKDGDLCDLSYGERMETFTVATCELCVGIVGDHWQAELERIRTP